MGNKRGKWTRIQHHRAFTAKEEFYKKLVKEFREKFAQIEDHTTFEELKQFISNYLEERTDHRRDEKKIPPSFFVIVDDRWYCCHKNCSRPEIQFSGVPKIGRIKTHRKKCDGIYSKKLSQNQIICFSLEGTRLQINSYGTLKKRFEAMEESEIARQLQQPQQQQLEDNYDDEIIERRVYLPMDHDDNEMNIHREDLDEYVSDNDEDVDNGNEQSRQNRQEDPEQNNLNQIDDEARIQMEKMIKLYHLRHEVKLGIQLHESSSKPHSYDKTRFEEVKKFAHEGEDEWPRSEVQVDLNYQCIYSGDYRGCVDFLRERTLKVRFRNGNEGKVEDSSKPPILQMTGALHMPANSKSEAVIKRAAEFIEKKRNSVFECTIGKQDLPRPPVNDLVKREKEMLKSLNKLPGSDNDEMSFPALYVHIKTMKEAHSPKLDKLVKDNGIVVLENFDKALNINVKEMSLEKLSKLSGNQKVPGYFQIPQPEKMNVDGKFNTVNGVWYDRKDISVEQLMRRSGYIKKKAMESCKQLLEATDMEEAIENLLKRKHKQPQGDLGSIPLTYFGTNVNLSKEKHQEILKHLEALPPLFRLSDDDNLLYHVTKVIFGVNSVQMYFKEIGSSTEAHQEASLMSSVNWNLGPGNSIWYAVPYEYWPRIEELKKMKGLPLHELNWFPMVEELRQFKIPVAVFVQKPGDLVHLNGGYLHWVKSDGLSRHISWNVGHPTFAQLAMAIVARDHNLETGNEAHIPLEATIWNMARAQKYKENEDMFNAIRGVLIRSLAYCKMYEDFIKSKGYELTKYKGNEDRARCDKCRSEIFNIVKWGPKDSYREGHSYCSRCEFESSEGVTYTWDYSLEELSQTLDEYV